MPRLTALAVSAAGFALGACSETAPVGSGSPLRTGGTVNEQACIMAVSSKTGNTVTVLSSEFSEANTLVLVGVGPDRAPWRCLVSDGIVAEVSSATDEGAL
jgi:hypothetical protein